VVTLPAMSSHLVFIQDPISNVTINSISLIDGDSLRTLGMLSGALESGFAISPDHQHLYMADGIRKVVGQITFVWSVPSA
jgi:hypothetical protein